MDLLMEAYTEIYGGVPYDEWYELLKYYDNDFYETQWSKFQTFIQEVPDKYQEKFIEYYENCIPCYDYSLDEE